MRHTKVMTLEQEEALYRRARVLSSRLVIPMPELLIKISLIKDGVKYTVIDRHAQSPTRNFYNACFYNFQGYSIDSGDYNVLIGFNAGYDLTDGASNVCIGSQAGANLTTSSNNVFIGQLAGRDGVTNTGCVLIGSAAGVQSTSNNNTSIGYLSIDGNNDQASHDY